MYLLAAESNSGTEKEISISYGNKGNEELLYLYGFVMDDNPDDYLMVHYPVEAFQSAPFFDTKAQLIEAQKGEMRCLLPKSLLAHGFFQVNTQQKERDDKITAGQVCNYSWSGQRKIPSYVNKLVFPDDFLTVLRTIAMTEDQLFQVSSLLQQLVANGEERQPSDTEVRAAIWEVCGDSGALQLLVDLLNTKMMDLEEGTGSEDADDELLNNAQVKKMPESCIRVQNDSLELMSRNKRGSIVYRRGQKQLVRLFLMEAESALHLSLSEGN